MKLSSLFRSLSPRGRPSHPSEGGHVRQRAPALKPGAYMEAVPAAAAYSSGECESE
jgi:hypothetical protein